MVRLIKTCVLHIVFIDIPIFIGAIQINYVEVPNAVKNNSNRPAILDCNYSIRPDDTDLIVKWYLNEELVYQWIPPHKPQSLGILKDGVDLEYKETDDPKSVYRALKINNPTTDVAGEYKCLVSTLADEDFSVKNMIVFEPEKQLSIRKNINDMFVNFTCLASDVYPSPKLFIYKEDKKNKIRLSIVEWNVKKNPTSGRYTISIVATERLSALNPGTLVNCELKIPGTGYVKIKSSLYYPEYHDGNGCSSQNFATHILVNIIIGQTLIMVINL